MVPGTWANLSGMNADEDTRFLPREIRAAGAALDGSRLGRLIAEVGIERHLQEAGEAMLAVLEHDRAAGYTAAKALAGLLNKRAWTGDAELAELLVELAEGHASEGRRIRADLDGVADLLEGSLEMGFGGVLDRETGDAWPEGVLVDWAGDGEAPDPDADPERYLFIPNVGARDAWEDMRDFAADVEDARISEQLLDAIDGRGAFSRFKRVLARHDELRAQWYAYSAEARVGRARDWLAGEGYVALPPRPA